MEPDRPVLDPYSMNRLQQSRVRDMPGPARPPSQRPAFDRPSPESDSQGVTVIAQLRSLCWRSLDKALARQSTALQKCDKAVVGFSPRRRQAPLRLV